MLAAALAFASSSHSHVTIVVTTVTLRSLLGGTISWHTSRMGRRVSARRGRAQ